MKKVSDRHFGTLADVPLCSHLLAPVYFAESVTSEAGFWGEPCDSYWQYVMGWCPADSTSDEQKTLMGDQCSTRYTSHSQFQ
jgi:hypothetical protein